MSQPSTGLSDHERKEGPRNGSQGARDPPDSMTPLSVKEVAQILKLDIKTVYEAIRKGQIPAIRVGKLLLVPRPSLMRLLRDGSEGNEAA
jgi:excisionase family DNA binding protein